jgi:hypothetical protein
VAWLAIHTGKTKYGPAAEDWDKAAIVLGGVAGQTYPSGNAFAPALLKYVRQMGGGGAYLAPTLASTNAVSAALPADIYQETQRWVSTRTGGRSGSVPNLAGSLLNVAAAVMLTTRLDNGRTAASRVVFEESTSGERRARVELDRVVLRANKTPLVDVEAGYVDEKGLLAGTPVTGEDPSALPIVIPFQQ